MKEKKEKIIVEVEVSGKLEAYSVVSDLALSHKVISAKFGDHREKFDKKNTPFHFMKNNNKNILKFRNILKERGLK